MSTIRKIFAAFLTAVLLSVFAFQVQGVSAQSNGKSPISSPCKPGNGFGDKNHCHSGPPGQQK